MRVDEKKKAAAVFETAAAKTEKIRPSPINTRRRD
jgi:hypothetical protein